MDNQIRDLALALINERLSNDPTNHALILEKLIFLHNFSRKDDDKFNDEFKNLNFDGLEHEYYHAWSLIDSWYKWDKKHNNFHLSLDGKQVVEIWDISKNYYEMNPEQFYYIGVVFGPQISCKKYKRITEEQKAEFVLKVKKMYSRWFHFPEAEDQFITKSLVGIEDACPICGGDEDLENCVIVRGGCDHAFHRGCLERWFSHSRKRECPTCRANHDKN
jgi:hypothetical protein